MLTNRILKDPSQRRFFKDNDLHELFSYCTSPLGHITPFAILSQLNFLGQALTGSPRGGQ